MPHRLTVDCSDRIGPLPRIWGSIGHDELNWAGSPRGRRNLGVIGPVLGAGATVRAHNIFTSGTGRGLPHWSSGNVYHEDAAGNPFYDWHVVDQAFDAWVEAGLRPIVELGFCPAALTRDLPGPAFVPMPSLYGRYEVDLWASPPRDVGRWGDLVAATVAHALDRYGEQEVSGWYWELWNEPDISYWQGTVQEYCTLYDVTAAAVRRVLPTGLVGGPATTGGGTDFLTEFLEHCLTGTNTVTGTTGTPLDFVSFHTKGAPGFPRLYSPVGPEGSTSPGERSPDTGKILAEVTANLDLVRTHPQLADIPVLVDECDPGVPAHYGVYDNPDYRFRNTAYYPVFQVQMMKRLLDLDRPDSRGIAAATAWAWYLEGDRYFEGTRSFFTAGDVATPLLAGYRLLDRLGPNRVGVRGEGSGCIDALASTSSDGAVRVLVWHHHDDQYADCAQQVTVDIDATPLSGKAVTVREYRIDDGHTNTYARWLAEGAPQDPDRAQLDRIRAAEKLELAAPSRTEANCPAAMTFTVELRAPAVSLLEIAPV